MITRRFLLVAEAVNKMQSGVDIECDRPMISDVGSYKQTCQDIIIARATNLAIGKHSQTLSAARMEGGYGTF